MWNDPAVIRGAVMYYVVTIISLALHELGHALTAVGFGDATPKEQGRLTLNPVKHMDLLGSFIVPVASLVLMPGRAPIAWAKPVEVSGYRFSRKISMRVGLMTMAIAGPATNFGLAILSAFALVIWSGTRAFPGGALAHEFTERMLEMNVLLFLWNAIPVPPLDGARVVKGLLPAALVPAWEKIEKFAPFLLAIMFFWVGAAFLMPLVDKLEAGLMSTAKAIVG